MKIAIWGLGVSGIAAVKFLANEKKHDIVVVNQGEVSAWYEKQKLASYIKQDACYSQNELGAATELQDLDLILLSPGVDPRIDELIPFETVSYTHLTLPTTPYV